jgi:hypothetical protein
MYIGARGINGYILSPFYRLLWSRDLISDRCTWTIDSTCYSQLRKPLVQHQHHFSSIFIQYLLTDLSRTNATPRALTASKVVSTTTNVPAGICTSLITESMYMERACSAIRSLHEPTKFPRVDDEQAQSSWI